MATKTKETSEVKATTKKVKENRNFLKFYDTSTRERTQPTYVLTDHEGKPMAHLEFTMASKWNKDTEKFEYTFINLIVKKRLEAQGDFEEVIRFVTGYSDKRNALWIFDEKPTKKGDLPKEAVSI